jgi:hypothetical protein
VTIDFKDFSKWEESISYWKDATNNVPLLVRDNIAKSKYSPDKVTQGPKSFTFDPYNVQWAMGFKDRKFSISYDVLKRIPQQLAVIAAIIQTRCNQVAAFGTPFRLSKSLGFAIKHKNPQRTTTKGEMEWIQSMESFIYQCGSKDPNPHSPFARDDFETFLKKIVRDSLMYDSATIEIIPDRKGEPYEFFAVDASTIRIASQDLEMGLSEQIQVNNNPYALISQRDGIYHPYKTLKVHNPELENVPAYVQYINGTKRAIYTRKEMAMGIRNPRTDIYTNGYGYSELEMLVNIITSHLNAETYNSKNFTQGSNIKGILNFRGENISAEQLEVIKRQWRENLEGVNGAFRTPIMQSEQGIDWINLKSSNAEMEYSMWMEYLIKVTCAVFMIDPAELNFDMHGGVQQTPLFESSQEWKLKASRDKGLKPMLRFVAKLINDNIVQPVDDHFVFDFVGLDELTEQEKHELRKEQISSYRTLNEIRKEEDMPPVQDGDIVLNPAFITYIQQKNQREMQEKQQEAMMGGGGGAPQGVPGAAPAQGSPTDKEAGPQYADGFTKSQSDNTRVLSIELNDDWMDSYEP